MCTVYRSAATSLPRQVVKFSYLICGGVNSSFSSPRSPPSGRDGTCTDDKSNQITFILMIANQHHILRLCLNHFYYALSRISLTMLYGAGHGSPRAHQPENEQNQRGEIVFPGGKFPGNELIQCRKFFPREMSRINAGRKQINMPREM